jgi:hypothetical protein
MSDPLQKVEAVRTLQRRNASMDAMLKLIARQAVLKAERDNSVPRIPQRLLKLVGAVEAANMIEEQQDRRKGVSMARRERERASTAAVETAKQDLRLYARTDALDELVKTRQERVDSMKALVDKNVVAKQVLAQVQAELSDAETRRQDAFNQYSQAKQRLAQLENDSLAAKAARETELQGEIEVADRQITDNEQEFDASSVVLATLPATRARFSETAPAKGDDQPHYVIVRQSATGPVQIPSDGMAVLRPGDLVDIAFGTAEAGKQDPAAPGAAPQKRGPIERASRREIGTASKD